MASNRWVHTSVLGIGLIALYATALQYAPIYLSHDEVLNAINGHSIASTGRDPNGRLLPLYIYITGDYWATPIVTYFTALMFAVLPVSETSIRLASVIVGLVSVLLMYFVARQIFKRHTLALIAAGLLALSPAHFIHSRLAVDHLYPVPFVLGWLWCLGRFIDRPRWQTLFAGTLLLGIGLYTYLASLMLMPVYLLLTAGMLFKTGHRSIAPYAVALAGFAVPMALLVPWYAAHPAHFTNQVNMYHVYDANTLNPAEGLWQLAGYESLKARIGVFYSGFSPSMLFFSGGSSIINGTRNSGVFLLPLAIFLAIGLVRALTGGLQPFNFVLLVGFFTAPLGPTVVKEMMVNRMLVVLPFAILLATYGVEQMFAGAPSWRRRVGIALLAFIPVQFAAFYRDYMGDYRLRSAIWFERNIRGMVDEAIALDRREAAPAFLLSKDDIAWVDYYWRFYLLKHGREDLLNRTTFFNPNELDPANVPAGAIVLCQVEGKVPARLTASGLFEQRALVREPTGDASFALFARVKQN